MARTMCAKEDASSRVASRVRGPFLLAQVKNKVILCRLGPVPDNHNQLLQHLHCGINSKVLYGSGDNSMRAFPIMLFAFTILSLVGAAFYFYNQQQSSIEINRTLKKPADVSPQADTKEVTVEKIRLYTSIEVTIFVLVACIFVMLASRYTPEEKHWAYATLGTLIGYWLKT